MTWRFQPLDAPRDIELLRDINPHERDLVLAAARPRRFPVKSVMTYQEEPANHLMLLWKGRARYFYESPDDRKLILKWITPGEIFGAAALVSRPSNYLVSTEAVRDCIVLEWEGPTICDLAHQYPLILENAQAINMGYLAWYVATHAALISQTAGERLASIVYGLAKSVGHEASGGIELDVTNEELAYSANITPYTTSRLISKWRRTGAIRKRKGKIVLRSPERFFLGAVRPEASL